MTRHWRCPAGAMARNVRSFALSAFMKFLELLGKGDFNRRLRRSTQMEKTSNPISAFPRRKTEFPALQAGDVLCSRRPRAAALRDDAPLARSGRGNGP